MNLIIEEIKVDKIEGQIETFRVVKSDNKVKSFVDKIDYKLKKSDEDISSDFLKVFISELNLMNLETTNFALNNQSLIKKIFNRNKIQDLINLIIKLSDKSSWIIAPNWLSEKLKSLKFDRMIKIETAEIEECYLGNFNSVTLLKGDSGYLFLQNQPISRIVIT
jgi:hypothetical protein